MFETKWRRIPFICLPSNSLSGSAKSTSYVNVLLFVFYFCSLEVAAIAEPLPYLRYPSGQGTTMVFETNGHVWSQQGSNLAKRVSKYNSEESTALISPDGNSIAFVSHISSSREVFVYSHQSNESTQITFDGGSDAKVQGWLSGQEVLYSKTVKSEKRGTLLFVVNIHSGSVRTLPLAEASEGCVLEDNFIYVKNQELIDANRMYQGGYAQKIYKIELASVNEKGPKGIRDASRSSLISGDYKGISRNPVCINDRVFFLSDRDGRFNIWSMNADGEMRKQHTFYNEYDVQTLSSSDGNMLYFQMAGDVYQSDSTFSRVKSMDARLPEMVSDNMIMYEFDPLKATQIGLSDTGNVAVLINRGKLWKVDIETGISSCIECKSGVRVRHFDLSPDGMTVAALHDASGEYDIYIYDLLEKSIKRIEHGISEPIYDFKFAPDRKVALVRTVSGQLYLMTLDSEKSQKINTISVRRPEDITWSKNGQYATFVTYTKNGMGLISILNASCGEVSYLTSGKYEVESPIFNNRADTIYFLAKTHFRSSVDDTWGATNHWPSYTNKSLIYSVNVSSITTNQPYKLGVNRSTGSKEHLPKCNVQNVSQTLTRNDLLLSKELPFVAGNYQQLFISGGRLYAISKRSEREERGVIVAFYPRGQGKRSAGNAVFSENVVKLSTSSTARNLIFQTDSNVFIANSGLGANFGDPVQFSLGEAMNIQIDLQQERDQMYREIWRLYRDHFWDSTMNNFDWKMGYDKYRSLISRVSNRSEFGEVVNALIAELGAGHTAIGFSDVDAPIGDEYARIGAELTDDGSLRIKTILDGNVDIFEERSPVSKASPALEVGDRITHLNGNKVASSYQFYEKLKGKVGLPVTLRVQPKQGLASDRIIKPISVQHEKWLRNRNWAYRNALRVNELSDKEVAYIHLHSAFEPDYSYFVREFSHLHERKAIILDLRGNNGGNIDSWILHFLQRKAWLSIVDRYSSLHQKYPVGSLNGKLVVLIDGDTYSDGELIAEGIRRLKLGSLVGTTTSGAGRWVNDENTLIDGLKVRIPVAASYVGTENKPEFIIEGGGVSPDIRVENDPYHFFHGRDNQLDIAVEYALKNSK